MHLPVTLQKGAPGSWSGPNLPGANSFHYNGPLGTLVIQMFYGKHLQLQFLDYFLHEPVELRSTPIAQLQSLLSLKGHLTVKQYKAKDIRINDGEYTLWKPGSNLIKTSLPVGKSGSMLWTHYKPQLYKCWQHIFPNLFFLRQKSTRQIQFTPTPLRAGTMTLEAVRAQLYHNFYPEIQEAFTELKTRESLFLHLVQCSLNAPTRQLTPRERSFAEIAYGIISDDISKHYTNEELARKTGINEADLKRIFKTHYGQGMFQLLQHLRWQKAKELLANGTNIKSVAAAIGYAHTTTFITEFRKKWGYTPLDYQKQHYK